MAWPVEESKSYSGHADHEVPTQSCRFGVCACWPDLVQRRSRSHPSPCAPPQVPFQANMRWRGSKAPWFCVHRGLAASHKPLLCEQASGENVRQEHNFRNRQTTPTPSHRPLCGVRHVGSKGDTSEEDALVVVWSKHGFALVKAGPAPAVASRVALKHLLQPASDASQAPHAHEGAHKSHQVLDVHAFQCSDPSRVFALVLCRNALLCVEAALAPQPPAPSSSQLLARLDMPSFAKAVVCRPCASGGVQAVVCTARQLCTMVLSDDGQFTPGTWQAVPSLHGTRDDPLSDPSPPLAAATFLPAQGLLCTLHEAPLQFGSGGGASDPTSLGASHPLSLSAGRGQVNPIAVEMEAYRRRKDASARGVAAAPPTAVAGLATDSGPTPPVTAGPGALTELKLPKDTRGQSGLLAGLMDITSLSSTQPLPARQPASASPAARLALTHWHADNTLTAHSAQDLPPTCNLPRYATPCTSGGVLVSTGTALFSVPLLESHAAPCVITRCGPGERILGVTCPHSAIAATCLVSCPPGHRPAALGGGPLSDSSDRPMTAGAVAASDAASTTAVTDSVFSALHELKSRRLHVLTLCPPSSPPAPAAAAESSGAAATDTPRTPAATAALSDSVMARLAAAGVSFGSDLRPPRSVAPPTQKPPATQAKVPRAAASLLGECPSTPSAPVAPPPVKPAAGAEYYVVQAQAALAQATAASALAQAKLLRAVEGPTRAAQLAKLQQHVQTATEQASAAAEAAVALP